METEGQGYIVTITWSLGTDIVQDFLLLLDPSLGVS